MITYDELVSELEKHGEIHQNAEDYKSFDELREDLGIGRDRMRRYLKVLNAEGKLDVRQVECRSVIGQVYKCPMYKIIMPKKRKARK